MGIRRRRKKLTSLISNMDRRIRSVEFKSTAYGVTATSEAEVAADGEVIGVEPPGSVYSPTLPNPWVRIKRALFYPSNVIAGNRFELIYYDSNGIESVSGASVERGDYVSVSSIGRTFTPVFSIGRTYFKNTNASNPYFTCLAHGTPDWDKRSTVKFNGEQVYIPLPLTDSFGTATHTYVFSSASTVTSNSIRMPLATRALITSHVATTTRATLTTQGAHHYTVDDIIDVNDLPEAYRGIDGLFKVTAVTSNTISYDFDTPLSAGISSATASSGVYVYSVAQKYVRVGSTWFDTANENRVYYWNGLRYQIGKVEGLQNDGSAPSPPTNLTLTTSGYNRPDGTSRSRVDLSWTAPTTSANGNTLDDLLGYKIRISETGYSNWRDTRDLTGPDTSETITNLDPDKEYYFRVTAYDSFGNESTGLDDSIVTGLAALAVEKTSAPTIPTPRLGVVSVSWNGRNATGGVLAQEMVKFVEVHASTTSGFTPSSGTLVGKIYRPEDPCLVTGLTYNATYYFKLVVVDTNGNSATPSEQTSTIIKPLVDTDIIGKVLDGANIKNGSITASDVIIGNTITGNLIQSNTIEAGSIKANSITADQINAGSVAAVTVTATTVSADVMSGSKTIRLYDPSISANAKIGYQIGGSYQDVSYSLLSGETLVGWFGMWGSGAIELGTNFTQNYIDMMSDNTMNIQSAGAGGVNIVGNLSVNGTRFYSYGRMVGYSGSDTGSVLIYDGYGGTLVFRVDTLNKRINVYGDIQYTGTITDTSSRRFKTNITPYSPGYSILDIPVVKYQYDFSKMDPSRSDIGEVLVGTIAEDAVAVGADDIVAYDEEGLPHGVDYSMIGLLLVPIVKELKDTVDELKKRVN